ncbi:MAG: DHH family phosphoesterase [Clostridia bacterium]|nr:DHH family phosphoesterase [Clostridia bacterium]MDD4386795.1 DHH family phosphoesterase [Clostridia bacterium]
MGNLKVFGHKNPDLDSVAATVGLSHLLQIRDGINCDMIVLGEFNKEVKYVFERFDLKLNLLIVSELKDGEEVALVDHNEFSQSIINIENAKIKIVVDHHKIDNFRTVEPLEYIAKPFGSTSTILYQLLQEINGVDNREVNILLLSAIISDTLLFKSPTTTKEDTKAAKELAEKLNIDIDVYGLDLLKAGADLSEISSDELIQIDSKEFDCNRIKDRNFSNKCS